MIIKRDISHHLFINGNRAFLCPLLVKCTDLFLSALVYDHFLLLIGCFTVQLRKDFHNVIAARRLYRRLYQRAISQSVRRLYQLCNRVICAECRLRSRHSHVLGNRLKILSGLQPSEHLFRTHTRTLSRLGSLRIFRFSFRLLFRCRFCSSFRHSLCLGLCCSFRLRFLCALGLDLLILSQGRSLFFCRSFLFRCSCSALCLCISLCLCHRFCVGLCFQLFIRYRCKQNVLDPSLCRFLIRYLCIHIGAHLLFHPCTLHRKFQIAFHDLLRRSQRFQHFFIICFHKVCCCR